MVKTKKNSLNNTTKFNSKKKQRGGTTAVSFGNYQYSGDTLSKAIKSESKLQETMTQTKSGKTKIIKQYAEDPRWGSSRGSSSYTQILGYLTGIRDKNIRAMEEIISVLGKKGTNYQLRAIRLVNDLHNTTVKERFRRIIQLKKDTDNAFQNASVKKLKKRKNQSDYSFELEKQLSDKVHYLRNTILNDIITLVRNENTELMNLLEGVMSNEKTKSFRNSI
jgi:hypothetical protein